MGFVTGTILLRNARFPKLALQIDARADPAVAHLCIPQRVCDRLRLEKAGDREYRSRKMPYVGPIEIRFEDRVGFVGALVVGDEVVLGTIAALTLELA